MTVFLFRNRVFKDKSSVLKKTRVLYIITGIFITMCNPATKKTPSSIPTIKLMVLLLALTTSVGGSTKLFFDIEMFNKGGFIVAGSDLVLFVNSLKSLSHSLKQSGSPTIYEVNASSTSREFVQTNNRRVQIFTEI